jgi:hypothetical protein
VAVERRQEPGGVVGPGLRLEEDGNVGCSHSGGC